MMKAYRWVVRPGWLGCPVWQRDPKATTVGTDDRHQDVLQRYPGVWSSGSARSRARGSLSETVQLLFRTAERFEVVGRVDLAAVARHVQPLRAVEGAGSVRVPVGQAERDDWVVDPVAKRPLATDGVGSDRRWEREHPLLEAGWGELRTGPLQAFEHVKQCVVGHVVVGGAAVAGAFGWLVARAGQLVGLVGLGGLRIGELHATAEGVGPLGLVVEAS